MRHNNLEVDSLTQPAKEYIVDDALIASGLLIDYPYPSHIKLRVSGMTVPKGLSLIMTGTPKDGEVLYITVVQPEDASASSEATLSDVALNVVGNSGQPGFTYIPNTDCFSPDPHLGTVTTFQLIFNLDTYYYAKLNEGMAFKGPVSYQYDWTTRVFDKPQKSRDVLNGPWNLFRAEVTGPETSTNPVYVERSSGPWKNGLALWVGTVSGTAYLYYWAPGGTIRRLNLGAAAGTAYTMAIRETVASSSVITAVCIIGSNVYRIALLYGASTLSLSSFTDIGNSATSFTVLYRDKHDDGFFWGDGASLMRAPGSSGPGVSVHTAAGTIYDLARAPNGQMILAGSSGPPYKVEVSPDLSGSTVATFVAFAVGASAAPLRGIAYDRVRNRWLGVNASDYTVWVSNDITGATWTQIYDLNDFEGSGDTVISGGPTFVRQVGNAIVVGDDSYMIHTMDGGVSWRLAMAGTITGDVGNAGIGYFGGRLIATMRTVSSGNVQVLVSCMECGRWGPFDFDK